MSRGKQKLSFRKKKIEVLTRKKNRQQTNTNKQKSKIRQSRTSYLSLHAFMEDTTIQDIAQMTATSKAYMPCLFITIIK